MGNNCFEVDGVVFRFILIRQSSSIWIKSTAPALPSHPFFPFAMTLSWHSSPVTCDWWKSRFLVCSKKNFSTSTRQWLAGKNNPDIDGSEILANLVQWPGDDAFSGSRCAELRESAPTKDALYCCDHVSNALRNILSFSSFHLATQRDAF